MSITIDNMQAIQLILVGILVWVAYTKVLPLIRETMDSKANTTTFILPSRPLTPEEARFIYIKRAKTPPPPIPPRQPAPTPPLRRVAQPAPAQQPAAPAPSSHAIVTAFRAIRDTIRTLYSWWTKMSPNGRYIFAFIVLTLFIYIYFRWQRRSPSATRTLADQMDDFCQQDLSAWEKRKPTEMYLTDGDNTDWIRKYENGRYIYCLNGKCQSTRPSAPITVCRFEDEEPCEADDPLEAKHQEKILYNARGADTGIRRIWKYGGYMYKININGSDQLAASRYEAITVSVNLLKKPLSFFDGASVCQ